MNKKVVKATKEGLTRLKAVEMCQKGYTQKEVAKIFGVDNSTIGDWLKMYNEEGVERLNAKMKPRPKHHLDVNELKKAIETATTDKQKKRLEILIELAEGMQLKLLALKHGLSAQMIMNYRRDYLNPPKPKKEIRGGKREGAGRQKSKYKMKTVSFYIREEFEEELRNFVLKNAPKNE